MTRQGDNAFCWSTDHVQRGERFAYWREVLSTNLIGMTPEAAPEDRGNFEGRVTRIPVRDTGVMQLDMQISRLRMERSAADIRAAPGNGVFLFRARSADMNFLFHDRDYFVPQPGTTVMGGLDRQRYSVVSRPGRYRCEVLRIPAEAFSGVVSAPSRLDPHEVNFSTGPSALLHGFFEAFLRELPRLTDGERAAAMTTLTGLTILSLRRDRAGDEPVRDAVRAARLQKAQDHVRRYAADPRLSPASTAQALRISVRQLHALFEPSGKTFSRFLAEQRVRHASEILAENATLSVAEVAFMSGFESLSTFYRVFKATTGAPPRREKTRLSL
jgi:AraC-like DNA-binding protein